ncbi:hypothetical protein DCAR_0313495 [Daucus carota subsp. sativus]|uniref:Subtilisin-like protease n=1 Tax=Daucus carota subsp. sativus TaxID=79200 RepID=A0AAF1AV17_DAUCS|nr:hypothetical protein DCAR_0313495 [Daucus carota subsp. sativus]
MSCGVLLALVTIFLQSSISITGADASEQTYIVHMKHYQKPDHVETHHAWYSSNLQSLSSSATLLYTYTTTYHGFSASLSLQEAQQLRQYDSVIDIQEESVYALHTTRTPEFLGLDREVDLWAGYSFQELNKASQDIIIGVLDSGVWSESESFADNGMPGVPSRWRGECESGPDFHQSSCNKKLIGARMFSKGYEKEMGKRAKETISPRDRTTGSPVANASMFGYANGTARGIASHARVATYKVCWESRCLGSDVLAGMESAMNDGVNVLSISIGGPSGPYYSNSIAIAAFTAMEKGIFVSTSVGNDGPAQSSLFNVAPWLMTVGAGTIDRDFPAYVVLGDGRRLYGVSISGGTGIGGKPVGIFYNKGRNSSNLCLAGSLDPDLVRGKVVVCDRAVNKRVEKGEAVKNAGGVGMILANTAENCEDLQTDSHVIPTVAVGQKMGDVIREYLRKVKNPTATLVFGGTVLGVRPSPLVAPFSSRGPNVVTPQILKPDVIGPGVSILAASSEAVGPSVLDSDTRRTKYRIMSAGTSMSCPHISGVAALLKAGHPDWSTSAIKSALMTTAYTRDNTESPFRNAETGNKSNPWAYGSGYVDPYKAMSPGLVYDSSPEDYIAFLCSLDYSIAQIQSIAKHSNITCSKRLSDPGQLNYPSFSVIFGKSRVVHYTRELTNVGAAGSAYEVVVDAPSVIDMTVNPSKLVFKNVGDKHQYTITFRTKKVIIEAGKSAFGSISWNNAKHQVSSPVAFSWTRD